MVVVTRFMCTYSSKAVYVHTVYSKVVYKFYWSSTCTLYFIQWNLQIMDMFGISYFVLNRDLILSLEVKTYYIV